MITTTLHSNGQVLRDGVPLSEISEILHGEHDVLWVDVSSPTPQEMTLIGEEFGFHPLAIEDAVRQIHRPKIDLFQKYFFLVFYCLEQDPSEAEWHPKQISIFAGQNFVVTVHAQPLSFMAETAKRWYETTDAAVGRTVGLLVYTLLDAMVDDYFPIIDGISDQIDDLEDRIFEHFDKQTQQELFSLKKRLLGIRKVVAPEREVLNVLLRRDSPIFTEATLIYLQDVYDHILRVTDAVDTYRDLLASALDVYLTVTSNRLNQVMKTLTASSIILMSMTLIAGVYGMNFDHMPELHWQLGYVWALALMAAIGLGLLRLFRRIDWL